MAMYIFKLTVSPEHWQEKVSSNKLTIVVHSLQPIGRRKEKIRIEKKMGRPNIVVCHFNANAWGDGECDPSSCCQHER